MANDRDLMQYSKEELAGAVNRLRGMARRYRDKAKEGAEEFMNLAIEAGGAFGVGYWIGTIRKDKGAELSEEDLQFWGIDMDLAIGLGAVLVGLSGVFGGQVSHYMKTLGRGVLAYWAGSQGEDIGQKEEEDEE